MARPGGLKSQQFAALRILTGTPVVIDPVAPFTDANYPVANAFDCRGFDTIYLGAEFVGGTNPTAVFEILKRDPDAADGLRWKTLLIGAPNGITQIGTPISLATPALDGTGMAEMRVDGYSLIYFRLKTLTSTPTQITILGLPGVRRLVQNDVE